MQPLAIGLLIAALAFATAAGSSFCSAEIRRTLFHDEGWKKVFWEAIGHEFLAASCIGIAVFILTH
jgi:hypothetical protein